MALPIGFLDSLSNPVTLLMLGVIALLLFGERLPEVGRTWGRKLVELKKNVENLQNQIRSVAMSATPDLSSLSEPSSARRDAEDAAVDREEATAPKFVPPPAEPSAHTGEGGLTQRD
jgi:sec-independent protein translocase protein TatA